MKNHQIQLNINLFQFPMCFNEPNSMFGVRPPSIERYLPLDETLVQNPDISDEPLGTVYRYSLWIFIFVIISVWMINLLDLKDHHFLNRLLFINSSSSMLNMCVNSDFCYGVLIRARHLIATESFCKRVQRLRRYKAPSANCTHRAEGE